MARLTLQNDLVDEMGRRIVSGHYSPGQMLLTQALESEFEISRTVVRESIKVLESMRLIEIKRSVGITILDSSQWNVYDPRIIRWRLSGKTRAEQVKSLTELRIAVEPIAAGLAARVATPEQRAQLITLSEQMDSSAAAGDYDAFNDQDLQFHSLMLRASGNEMFVGLSEALGVVIQSYERDSQSRASRLQKRAVSGHFVIANHISNGNDTAAEEVLRSLLVGAWSQLVAEFETPSS